MRLNYEDLANNYALLTELYLAKCENCEWIGDSEAEKTIRNVDEGVEALRGLVDDKLLQAMHDATDAMAAAQHREGCINGIRIGFMLGMEIFQLMAAPNGE